MNIVDEFADFVSGKQNNTSKLYVEQFIKVEFEKIEFEKYIKDNKWILNFNLKDVTLFIDENFKDHMILYFSIEDEDIKNIIFQYISRNLFLKFKIFEYSRQIVLCDVIKIIISVLKRFFRNYKTSSMMGCLQIEQLLDTIYSSMKKSEFYNCPRYITNNYISVPTNESLFKNTCEDIFHKLFKNKFVVLDTPEKFLAEYVINQYVSMYRGHFEKICRCEYLVDFDFTKIQGFPWSNSYFNIDYDHHIESCDNYLAVTDKKHLLIFYDGMDFLTNKKFDSFIKSKNIYCIFACSFHGNSKYPRNVTEENVVSCYQLSVDEISKHFSAISQNEKSKVINNKIKTLISKKFDNIYITEIFANAFGYNDEDFDKIDNFLDNNMNHINNYEFPRHMSIKEKEIFKNLIFVFEFINLTEDEIKLLFLLCLVPSGEIQVSLLEKLTNAEWNDQIASLQAKNLVFYQETDFQRIIKINSVILDFIPIYFKLDHKSEIFNIFTESLNKNLKTDSQREISACMKEAYFADYIIKKYGKYQIENISIRNLIIKMADFMYYMQRYKTAIEYYNLSLSVYRAEKHPDIYFNLSLCLGNCLYNLRKYDELEKLYSDLVPMYKKNEGRYSVKIAILYYNMAKVSYKNNKKNNKKNKTIDLCKKAMEIFKNSYDENLLHLRNFYMVSSVLHLKSKEYEEALSYLHQAAKESERLFGEDSDESIDCYQKIAVMYMRLHRPSKSVKWFTKALGIYKDSPEKYSVVTIAEIYSQLALVYSSIGKYENSLSYLEKSLAIYFGLFGANSYYTAGVYKRIASVLCRCREFEKSLEWNLKDLEVCESLLQKNDDRLAVTYTNLCTAYLGLFKFDEAAKWVDQSIYIRSVTSGNNSRHSLELAKNYVQAAETYIQKSMYNKAINFYYEKALKIYRDNPPKSTEGLIDMYNCLGSFYNVKCDYDKAYQYYKKALEFCKEYLPENKHDLAEAYSNIGDIYKNKCEFSKALECFERTEKIYRDNHSNFSFHIEILTKLSGLYSQMGLYNKSVNIGKKAMYIIRKNKGDDCIQSAEIHYNIADVYKVLGKYDKSLEHFELSLAIYEKVFGKHNIFCSNILRNMAVIYDIQGLHIEGKDLCRKSIYMSEKLLGKNHPYTAEAYNDMAYIYINQGMKENAKKWSLIALDIQSKVLPKRHMALARTYTNIGLVNDLENNFNLALDNYFKAIEIYENLLQPDHVLIGIVYNYVALSYKTCGKYDKSIKYFKLARKILSKSLNKDHYYLKINEKGTELVNRQLI